MKKKQEMIMQTLSRAPYPLSVQEIAQQSTLSDLEVLKILENLRKSKRVRTCICPLDNESDTSIYYYL